jgi:predicted GIY-YIG superfamily endonuclease
MPLIQKDSVLSQNLYRHFDESGNLLYVGISLNAINRLAQHRDHAHWFNNIKRVEIETYGTRQEAIEAEKHAIINENPLHNLYRPKAKEQAVKQVDADASRFDLLKRIVHFNPMYSMSGAASALEVGAGKVKEWILSGQLGCIEQGGRRKITGWQLIDFIENLERGDIK